MFNFFITEIPIQTCNCAAVENATYSFRFLYAKDKRGNGSNLIQSDEKRSLKYQLAEKASFKLNSFTQFLNYYIRQKTFHKE